jgi:N-acyl homoserine lactone hydrolase
MKTILPLLLLLSACATLPTAPEHAFSPLPEVQTALEVCWIDTGGLSVPGGYGAGGTTTAQTWEATSPALLIRHPRGDLVLDTGISPKASEERAELTGWRHFVFGQTAGRNVPRRNLSEALAALGAAKPLALLLSHAHADHAGGVSLIPDVPVWLAEEEIEWMESGKSAVIPAQARAMKGRTVPLPFVAEPFANYDAHYDVFGDGSVVVVPTFGHTPGSVATFINVSPTKRLVHVGDLINLSESIDRKVGKSWLMRRLTDEDDAATQAAVAKLVQLREASPDLVILPAHDRPAYVRLFGEDDGALPPCIR